MKQRQAFAAWLRHVRHELQYSQDQFAEQLNYATVTYRKVERGLAPSAAFLERLAMVLELPASDMRILHDFANSDTALQALSLPDHLEHLQPQVAQAKPAIAATPHTLPMLPYPLIGREREVETLTKLLQHPQHRLITVIGPPGVGKTRVAQAVGWASLGHFCDGIWYVEGIQCTTIADFWVDIANMLGRSANSSMTLIEQISALIGQKNSLLILDNCEHLSEINLGLAQLLAQCSGLKILVTSRTSLKLRIEHLFWLHPFPTPDPQSSNLSAIWQNPAVQLFCQRAQASNHEWQINDSQAATIAQICQHLDGLPLVIELAAVRTQFVTPTTLLARLSNRLGILTNTMRDAPAHQSTLRRTLEWSYQLLDSNEQQIFARLSVFATDSDFEAIVAVCADLAPSNDDIFDCMASLVAKSLVIHRPDPQGNSRFGMLATIREFAASLLAEQQQTHHYTQRYINYYIELAEKIDRELRGKEQIQLLEQLESEFHHWQAVLRLCLNQQQYHGFLRLFAALSQFWYGHGHFMEAWQWLSAVDQALNHVDSPIIQARAALGAGIVTNIHHCLDLPLGYLERALDLCQQLNDQQGIATCYLLLGLIMMRKHQYVQATRWLNQSLNYFESSVEYWLLSINHLLLAQLNIYLNDLDQASRYLDLVGHSPQLRLDPFRSSWYQSLQGHVAFYKRCYTEALTWHQQSLVERQQLGIKGDIAVSWLRIAQTERALGHYQPTRNALEQSLKLWQMHDNQENVLHCLEEFAALLAYDQQHQTATYLLSYAWFQREQRQLPHPPIDQARSQQFGMWLQNQQPSNVWREAWSYGQTLKLDQVIGFVLAG
ncbi:MAG TPA: hypothetical protein DEF47_20370 [Herpetosiphon sp.]|uniref:Transcriptional regulator, XRE family n=1 Tax=Herpetosiphon aurantiacus (strain ATCC 23779 / DSM 785 / 114-95) TaxID=316274 RepID=A9B7X0_HERA2|nr:AAA family ATPase [Herpetosiphon sp.]ABX04498.1 transcriptional regulator, XRE family [Herpetosiphon aurantiacus DSM 785]HBW52249.1 hypothetical protein [Herpetosiphon sp.]